MYVLLCVCIYFLLQVFDAKVILIVEGLLLPPCFLDGAILILFLYAYFTMGLCELSLFLLHALESLEYAHDAEIVHVYWSKII